MYHLNINGDNDNVSVLKKYMFNNVKSTSENNIDNKPLNNDNKPLNNDNKPLNNDKKPLNNDNKPLNNDKKPLNNDKKPLNDNKQLNNNNNNNNNNKKLTTNSEAPRSSVFPDYNKAKSKLNEIFTHSNEYKLTDTFFWCFYKLHFKLTDNDLEYINIFTTEKEFKITIIDKIHASKELLKKHKIQKNFITTEITNDKKITLYTFKALCILYNIDIVVIKDNNTYACFTDNNLENNTETIDNLETYQAIKIVYNNTSSVSKNFKIVMDIVQEELQYAVNNYYYVNNLEKPLKSIGSYKSPEIIEIAVKLNITLTNEDGKKKTKIELYAECVKKLT
jgi:hypothetical protein